MQSLDELLRKEESAWLDSVEALETFLFDSTQNRNPEKKNYAEALVDVVESLNDDLWNGVERCLLEVLRGEVAAKQTARLTSSIDSLFANMYI